MLGSCLGPSITTSTLQYGDSSPVSFIIQALSDLSTHSVYSCCYSRLCRGVAVKFRHTEAVGPVCVVTELDCFSVSLPVACLCLF